MSEFDGISWTTYTTADGLLSDYVSALAIDRDGHGWFGTGNGLSRYIPDGTSAAITPVGGGSLASADDSISVEFSPGAVDAVLDLAIIPESPSRWGLLRTTGHGYDLYALEAGTSGPPVETISGTYTVTVEYTDDEVSFIQEGTLKLYSWNGAQWVPEASSLVFTDTNTLTATPNHFSHWAVLGEPSSDLSYIYLPLIVRND